MACNKTSTEDIQRQNAKLRVNQFDNNIFNPSKFNNYFIGNFFNG